jgi:hypothetical protein
LCPVSPRLADYHSRLPLGAGHSGGHFGVQAGGDVELLRFAPIAGIGSPAAMRAPLRQACRSLGAGTTQPSDCTSNLGSLADVAPVRSAASVLLWTPNSGVAAVLISSARQGAFGQDSVVRVVSWNLNYRGVSKAGLQGELLRELKPDLIPLQEGNLGSVETLRQAAEADWLVCAADLRQRAADDRPVRSRGVAIAGHGPVPQRAWIPADVPLPERILLVETTVKGLSLTAVS